MGGGEGKGKEGEEGREGREGRKGRREGRREGEGEEGGEEGEEGGGGRGLTCRHISICTDIISHTYTINTQIQNTIKSSKHLNRIHLSKSGLEMSCIGEN